MLVLCCSATPRACPIFPLELALEESDRPNTTASASQRLSVFHAIVKERLSSALSGLNKLIIGGDNRARTGNLRRAKAVLSQLSYIPKSATAGLHRRPATPEHAMWA